MIVADDTKGHRDFGVFRHLRELVWRHKVLVIAPILVGAVAGLLLFKTATKRYEATAVVVLDVRKVTVAPLEMVISRLPQDNPAIKTEIDVLSSRSMAENVIQRVGVENFGPLLALPSNPGSDERYRQALVDGLTSGLQISNDGRSFTIYISFAASDPVFAALIANAYAEQYFAHQTAVKLNAVRTASEWLGKKVEELRRKLEVSERAVDTLSAKNLNELQREVAANRSLYESFLTRYKSTIEQEDLAGPEAQLVSEARPPSRPSTPKLLPLLALGIFLGASGGLAAAFLREHFDDRVWSLATLEERCGIPVLGAVPMPRSKGVRWPSWIPIWIRKRLELTSSTVSGGYDPALQKLQAALRFSPGTRDARVVAITSPSQGEGKTFVSIALARAISAAGSSVLVVGADLHRPALGERMRVKTTCSWEEIVARNIAIEDVVQKDPESNVSLINATCSHLAPLTIFTSIAFEHLIADLRMRYDRILIDTPPISVSADTAVLGAIADVTILVVRWRATTYGAIIEALRQMALCSLRIGGIVLNQLDPHSTIRYASKSPLRADSGDVSPVGGGTLWSVPARRPLTLAHVSEQAPSTKTETSARL